jgi:exonuclease SbcD
VQVLRVAHFADLHLGVETGGRPNPSTGLNQRVHDVCDRLDEVCAAVEEDGVHVVVFAGDAFMNPRPTPTLQRLFAERVRRMLRSGAAVFLLVGNHDLPKMAGIAHPHAIYTALEIEGVVIGDRAEVYRVPLGSKAPAPFLQIAALPHFSKAEVAAQLPPESDAQRFIEERVAERVRALGDAIDPDQPAIFAGHCHVTQAEVGETQTLFGVSDVEVSLSTLTSGQPFAYYALGHVHKRQVLSKDPFVAYPGSLERVDFGEGDRIVVPREGKIERRAADDKGFYRVDLAGRELSGPPDFRVVNARGFLSLRVGELATSDPMADLEGRLARVRSDGIELDDAFVRIVGSVEATDRGRVLASSVRALVPEAYDVRLALESLDGSAVRDPRFATRMTEIEALERYASTREDWAEDRDELVRLGRELISEVLA